MRELTVNLDLFGPYIRKLYNDQLILGFGIHSGVEEIHHGVYYVVTDETAAFLAVRTPPGAIVEVKTVETLEKSDKEMAELIACLVDEELPEIILDFAE